MKNYLVVKHIHIMFNDSSLNWKTVAAGEKPLRAKERTHNKHNHIWCRHRDFNPGNINRKRVLSPLKPTFLVTHSKGNGAIHCNWPKGTELEKHY